MSGVVTLGVIVFIDVFRYWRSYIINFDSRYWCTIVSRKKSVPALFFHTNFNIVRSGFPHNDRILIKIS